MKSRVPSNCANMTFASFGFNCLAFILTHAHQTFDITSVCTGCALIAVIATYLCFTRAVVTRPAYIGTAIPNAEINCKSNEKKIGVD